MPWPWADSSARASSEPRSLAPSPQPLPLPTQPRCQPASCPRWAPHPQEPAPLRGLHGDLPVSGAHRNEQGLAEPPGRCRRAPRRGTAPIHNHRDLSGPPCPRCAGGGSRRTAGGRGVRRGGHRGGRAASQFLSRMLFSFAGCESSYTAQEQLVTQCIFLSLPLLSLYEKGPKTGQKNTPHPLPLASFMNFHQCSRKMPHCVHLLESS